MSEGRDTPSQKPATRYIAVEGPIGVGKTTLARQLARALNYNLLEESVADNPFLTRFYKNPRAAALPTQLFFLFQRTQQLEELRQRDLFTGNTVSDYLMDKDRLFAEVVLDRDELTIYEQVASRLSLEAPAPDLVIYLQATDDVLNSRIRSRGIDAERFIDSNYIATLNAAYMKFFHFYAASPLLIVNASDIDLANNVTHIQQLVQMATSVTSGRHYYNPNPTL